MEVWGFGVRISWWLNRDQSHAGFGTFLFLLPKEEFEVGACGQPIYQPQLPRGMQTGADRVRWLPEANAASGHALLDTHHRFPQGWYQTTYSTNPSSALRRVHNYEREYLDFNVLDYK